MNYGVDKEAIQYINGLKDKDKKEYAIAYYEYKTGETAEKPFYKGQSAMAEQAVEMRINSIVRKITGGN